MPSILVEQVLLMLCGRLLLIVLLRLRVLLGLRQLDETSVLRCVVGATAGALHSQHMERHRAVGLAVITHNLESGRRKINK